MPMKSASLIYRLMSAKSRIGYIHQYDEGQTRCHERIRRSFRITGKESRSYRNWRKIVHAF